MLKSKLNMLSLIGFFFFQDMIIANKTIAMDDDPNSRTPFARNERKQNKTPSLKKNKEINKSNMDGSDEESRDFPDADITDIMKEVNDDQISCYSNKSKNERKQNRISSLKKKKNKEINKSNMDGSDEESRDGIADSSSKKLRKAIDNKLHMERVNLQRMNDKIHSMKDWENRSPKTFFLSACIDLIGGTVITGVTLLGSDLFDVDENIPSLKIFSDVLQIGFGVSIVGLKLLDLYVDNKLKDCKDAVKKFDKEKDKIIEEVMSSSLANQYDKFALEDAANAYLTKNMDIPHWIKTGKRHKKRKQTVCSKWIYNNCCTDE